MKTPRTDKARYQCNDLAQLSDAGFRGAYDAMTTHAEGLELEIAKERNLADRLAETLANVQGDYASTGGITTPEVDEALAAWKEARRE